MGGSCYTIGDFGPLNYRGGTLANAQILLPDSYYTNTISVATSSQFYLDRPLLSSASFFGLVAPQWQFVTLLKVLLVALCCNLLHWAFCFLSRFPFFLVAYHGNLYGRGLDLLGNLSQLVQPFPLAHYTHYQIQWCFTVKSTNQHPNNNSDLCPVFPSSHYVTKQWLYCQPIMDH